ncbi:TonB-dependent receptor [Fulvivirgaceae bacterium BMA10]|uniref:TonB-dependent receptor n=1 Tax=Splendidivirga corallicola TaxID=3051826 RepID=A0ABT8KU26_9BACT|nr:TonB-dependent receptor [Fulvivirgaceae bacterium BMA10]
MSKITNNLFIKELLFMSRQAFNGLIIVFLLSGMLMAHDSDSQRMSEIKITLEQKSSNLGTVLSAIENQTTFTFSYSQSINLTTPISIAAAGKSLDIILKEIGYQAKINFFRRNDLIAVSNAKSTAKKADIIVVLDKEISGKVNDVNGDGLPGVNVVVKGTTIGTITDADGNYIFNVPDDAEVLVFSYVGYTSEEVEIAGRSTINISLTPDISTLSEVVVIGYGTVQKKDLTGAVASVDGEHIENQPVARVDQILQGKIAGAQITSVSGAPWARSTIRIRGGNSLQGNNEPLWVIDGFIAGTNFDLNSINPNDIESIDVLKDATSLSIYGTRGANGVILVTTKNGANLPEGKPQISLNTYSGVQNFARKIDLLTGPELAAYLNEGATLNGSSVPFADLNAVTHTDWQEEIVQVGKVNNIDFSFTGNNKNINYFLGFNFFDQKGIIKESGLTRYQVRANLDNKLGSKVTVGTRLNLSYNERDNVRVSFFDVTKEAFTAYTRFDADGNFNTDDPIGGRVFDNPLADLSLRENSMTDVQLLGNFYMQYEPIKGIMLKSTFGTKLQSSRQGILAPGDLPLRASVNSGSGVSINENFARDLLNENTITFSKDIASDHSIDGVLGFTWQTVQNESSNLSTEGDIVTIDRIELGDVEQHRVNSGFNKAQFVSHLGRLNYTYKGKYLLTLVGRRDGSSRFAEGNKYNFFPSAAVAWRMIEEPFIQNLGIFDDLKLRASYGQSGSTAIGSYRTLALLNTNQPVVGENGTQGVVANGVVKGRPAQPSLGWETTNQLDIGLEASFFEGRLNIEMDYYKKRTKDLLINLFVPPITGFGSRLENFGEIQNQGLEMKVDATIMDKNSFKWEAILTMAGNRSKALDIGTAIGANDSIQFRGNNSEPFIGIVIEGQPVGQFWGGTYLGTVKTQEELDNLPDNVFVEQFAINNNLPGFPSFLDDNGDGAYNSQDYGVIGNPEPDFYGGLINSFSYKNFHLDINLQFTYGNDIYYDFTRRGFFGGNATNVFGLLRDRWTEENPTSNVPRAGSFNTGSTFQPNQQYVYDGSFLRLQSLRFSYDVPVSSISWLEGLNVYFVGNNLALWSNYIGYDPEVNTSNTNSVVRGTDRATYPRNRSYTFGLNVKF